MDITLTAAERDEILAVFQTWEDNPSVDERALMVEAVEIILAARLTDQREQIAVEVRDSALDFPWYGSRGETRMVDISVEGLAADLYHLIRKTPRSGRAR